MCAQTCFSGSRLPAPRNCAGRRYCYSALHQTSNKPAMTYRDDLQHACFSGSVSREKIASLHSLKNAYSM